MRSTREALERTLEVMLALLFTAAMVGMADGSPAEAPKMSISVLEMDGAALQMQQLASLSVFGGHHHTAPAVFRHHTASATPKLSWQLSCDCKSGSDICVPCRDARQLAYRLEVTELAGDKPIIWDSGVVRSASLSATVPAAHALSRSSVRHTIRLQVWTSTISSGVISAAAAGWFHTALLNPAREWQGKWLSGGTMLRTEFNLTQQPTANITSASLVASGVGCFHLIVDGVPLDPSSRLNPGFSTAPRARVLYRAFDVAAALAGTLDGTHVIRVQMGFCKYGYLDEECVGAHGSHAKCRAVNLQLDVHYADSTTLTVATTAGRWEATTAGNPITYTHLYHGEEYDGRLEQDAWDRPRFRPRDPALWSAATRFERADELGILSLHPMPPIRVNAAVPPIYKTTLPSTSDGVVRILYDFGANFAGVTQLTIDGGAAGAAIVVRHAEAASNETGVANAYCGWPSCLAGCMDQTLGDGNCANQTDRIILGQRAHKGSIEAGAGRTVWAPLFTYHGFRYTQLEVSETDFGKISAIEAKALWVHSALPTAGAVRFNSSKFDILNEIQKSYLQTERNNLMSIATDCPTREKRGWLGDAQVTTPAVMLNWRAQSFYSNWVRTMADVSEIGCDLTNPTSPYLCCPTNTTLFGCSGFDFGTDFKGSLPEVIPDSRFSAHGGVSGSEIARAGWPGDPVWEVAAAIIPYEAWQRTGDTEAAAQAYPTAVALIEFWARHGDPREGGLINYAYETDWLALEICSPSMARQWSLPGPSCILANESSAGAQLAGVDAVLNLAKALGRNADVARYTEMYQRLGEAYHETFFNISAGCYAGNYQTANVLGLYFNATPPEHVASVVAALVGSITSPTGPEHDDKKVCNGTVPCLGTGFWGTRYALQTLARHGHEELALALATKTEAPSWGAMARSLPGTFWESWNGASRDHPALAGGIALYLYQLAGLAESNQHDTLAFKLTNTSLQLGSADVAVHLAAGLARFSWIVHPVAGSWFNLQFNVSVPVGHVGEASVEWPAVGNNGVGCRMYVEEREVGLVSPAPVASNDDNSGSVNPNTTGVLGPFFGDKVTRLLVLPGFYSFTVGCIPNTHMHLDRS